MRRRQGFLSSAVAFLGLLGTAGTVAADAAAISADLEGREIPAIEVGQYHCHDLDFPRLHCFRSSAAVEREVDRFLRGRGESSTLRSAQVLAVNYVRIFADAGYGGSSMYLSVNYDNLSSIGWNDRISSFKALNSLRGSFHTGSYGDGSAYGFCCNQQVTYVGSAFNDTFSSVYRL